MWNMSIRLSDGQNHPLTKNHAKWLLTSENSPFKLKERSFKKGCECKYAHGVGGCTGIKAVRQRAEERRKANERHYGQTANWKYLKANSTTGRS